MSIANKPVRQSVSLPAHVARRVKSLAGLDAREQEKKRFLCGEGQLPKTFLLRGQPAKGERLALRDYLDELRGMGERAGGLAALDNTTASASPTGSIASSRGKGAENSGSEPVFRRTGWRGRSRRAVLRTRLLRQRGRAASSASSASW
jgi:hypothetical protein